MKVLIHGRHVNITDRIEEHINKRVERLERHMPQSNEARIELSHLPTKSQDDSITCQITIRAKKRILRAEESGGTVYSAIDKAADKIDRQIEKVAGRQKRHQRVSLVENTEAVLTADPDMVLAAAELPLVDGIEMPDIGQLKRRKEAVLHPMTEEEAIEQMELLDHDFFLFFNAADDTVNLLYRRKDDNYGLIQPRFE